MDLKTTLRQEIERRMQAPKGLDCPEKGGKEMSKKISVRPGFLVGLDLEEGNLILRILTGVRSCKTGEWGDEIIRIPYTGPCEKKDLDQLINLQRVRIIIEPDEDDKEEKK